MKGRFKYSQQRGVAVITVMLVIALMMIMIAFFTERQQLFMRRLSNQLAQEQAYQYSMGVEQWALKIIKDDLEQNVDFWSEDWAKFGEPENTEEGENPDFSLTLSSQKEAEKKVVDFGIDQLEYQIIDLQGRYNLNNFANENPAYIREQRAIFENLLYLLEIGNLEDRRALANNLIDWIDDNDGRIGGSSYESSDYQSKETPYYAADQEISTIGELKFVEGFTAEIITKLAPYVSALPVDSAKININTTSAQVLGALNRSIPYNMEPIQAFLAQRLIPEFGGFRSTQAAETAINQSSLQSSQNGGFIRNMLQINSDFFQIRSRVVLGKLSYCSTADVFRETIKPNPNGQAPTDRKAPEFKVYRRSYQIGCDEIIRKS